MDKMNKILYVVLDILPFAWLMKHLLNGYTVAHFRMTGIRR